MKQWTAEVVVEHADGGSHIEKRSFYLPTAQDVRTAVAQKGGQVITITEQKRGVFERILARSSWFQLHLLRQIKFSSDTVSPAVAFSRIIENETDAYRQHILAPARDIIERGLGIIDALKALRIFDAGVMSVLSAADKANNLKDGIPHAIKMIVDKGKAQRQIMLTIGWLAFDLFTVITGIIFGRDMIFGFLDDLKPTNAEKAAQYENAVYWVSVTWDVLLYIAYIATAFGSWLVLSSIWNRGKPDYLAARITRKIPLIGHYLRDLGFADSMMAAARMIEGGVRIDETLKETSETTTLPEIKRYWNKVREEVQKGVNIGQALDRDPLSRMERLEMLSVSKLDQLSSTFLHIADLRQERAKMKHAMIFWLALIGTGAYLFIAVASALYVVSLMGMSIESVMGGLA